MLPWRPFATRAIGRLRSRPAARLAARVSARRRSSRRGGRNLRRAALCTSLASIFVLSTSSLAAPIRVVSPGTGLFLGNVVIGRASFVERSGAGADVSTIEASVTGLYSPTTNTLFGIEIPYVDKRLDIKGVKDQTTHGLGDIALIGHYRFWNRPKKGYRDMAAGRVVIEVPTGSTGRSIDPGVPRSSPKYRW